MMKIGIYGGTFNPPHLGHLTAARAVFEMLRLDKLLLIPAGLPPHKDMPAGSPTPQQRLEMTRLAAEQIGRFFAAVEEGAPLDPWLDRDFGGTAYRETEPAPRSVAVW